MENKTDIITHDSLCIQTNIDCVSFCPINECNNLLLIGLYQLEDEKNQVIKGGFQLYDTSKNKLELLKSEIGLPGVFDLKWINKRYDGKILFVGAFVDSHIRIFSIDEQFKIKQEYEILIKEFSSCLYIDVQSIDMNKLNIIVTLDSESLYYLKIDLADFRKTLILNQLGIIQKFIFNDHKYNVWCGAIQQSNQNVFLSGGDDCKMNLYDIRNNEQQSSQRNTKSHMMGITCLSFCPNNQDYFLSGSYDEQARLWDIRNLKHPVYEYKFDGGVWRAIWNPCMTDKVIFGIFDQQKYQVLGIDKNTMELQTVEYEYSNHDSFAYGADWRHSANQIIASISFYDKKINLWSQCT